jgi:hypothetical protein
MKRVEQQRIGVPTLLAVVAALACAQAPAAGQSSRPNIILCMTDDQGWGDVSGGLRGRKGDMYEGGIRVPGVIEWPARIKQPVVTEIPAGVVDIYPTLVEIMQAKVPHPVEPLDGISLLPLMDGQMKERSKPMGFWQGYGGTATGPAAWSDNRHKLVKLGDKKYELYDLTVDLSEQTNLAALHPTIVNRMKTELETWQQSVLRSCRGEDYPDNRSAGDKQAIPGPVQKANEPVTAAQPGTGPLKVFILAGQSNMDGNANVSTIDFLGEDKEHGALLKTFKPDAKTLVTRDDVWVAHRGVYGHLGPGYGARKSDDELGNCIGPEYAFGYFMGEALNEQVLLIIGKQKEVRDGHRFVNTVPEFKGNVKAIETAPLLHPDIVAIKTAGWLNKERDLKKQPVTPEEEAMLKRATSNLGYHYFGEGRFFILLGKGFAETMLELLRK